MPKSKKQQDLLDRYASVTGVGIDAIEYVQRQRHLVALAHEEAKKTDGSDKEKLARIEVLLDSFLVNTDEPLVDMLGSIERIFDGKEIPHGCHYSYESEKAPTPLPSKTPRLDHLIAELEAA